MNDIDQNDQQKPLASDAQPPVATDEVSARVAELEQNYMGATNATAASGESQAFGEQLPVENAQLQPVGMNTALQSADVIREQDKIMLVLAYIFPFVPFFTVSDSDYVKWHAKQGMALLITCVVGIIAISFIPLIGCVASPLFCIAVSIACIKGIIEALKPARWEIPLVAKVSQKLFG